MTQWREKINLKDVFHNVDLSFPEQRDAIVDRLRASQWYRRADENSDLHDLVAELGITSNEDEFDELWDQVYDLADYDNVWLGASF